MCVLRLSNITRCDSLMLTSYHDRRYVTKKLKMLHGQAEAYNRPLVHPNGLGPTVFKTLVLREHEELSGPPQHGSTRITLLILTLILKNSMTLVCGR